LKLKELQGFEVEKRVYFQQVVEEKNFVGKKIESCYQIELFLLNKKGSYEFFPIFEFYSFSALPFSFVLHPERGWRTRSITASSSRGWEFESRRRYKFFIRKKHILTDFCWGGVGKMSFRLF